MVTKKDIGALVRYYKEGWYHGHLVKLAKTVGVIQPIPGYKGKKPHPIKLPLEDIESL